MGDRAELLGASADAAVPHGAVGRGEIARQAPDRLRLNARNSGCALGRKCRKPSRHFVDPLQHASQCARIGQSFLEQRV